MNARAMPLRHPCHLPGPAQARADEASLLAAGSVSCDTDVADLARSGRRALLLTGAAVADVFALASVMVELGTQVVRDGGRVRLEVWHRGDDALEVLAFEPTSQRGVVRYGQSVAAMARVASSVELRQGGEAGLRVRVQLRLDDARQV